MNSAMATIQASVRTWFHPVQRRWYAAHIACPAALSAARPAIARAAPFVAGPGVG